MTEVLIDPVFRTRIGSDGPDFGGLSLDQRIANYVVGLLHDDRSVALGGFLQQDVASLGVTYPTINYRTLQHLVGKWQLGMAVLNRATESVSSTTVGRFLSDEQQLGQSARITFLCALILDTYEFPFEEVFRVVRSPFSDEVLANWLDQRFRIKNCNSRSGMLDRLPKMNGKDDFTTPDVEGLKLILDLNEDSGDQSAESTDGDCKDRQDLWRLLGTFMRGGRLSLGSLDRIMRLATLLDIPCPVRIQEDRNRFLQDLIGMLSLRYVDRGALRQGAGRASMEGGRVESDIQWHEDSMILASVGNWYLGVETRHWEDFSRQQRELNDLAEFLHRRIFSDKRYISLVAALHQSIKCLKDSEMEQEHRAEGKDSFFSMLFRFHTCQSLMRHLWKHQSRSKGAEFVNPVRWGNVMDRWVALSNVSYVVEWLPGKLEDSARDDIGGIRWHETEVESDWHDLLSPEGQGFSKRLGESDTVCIDLTQLGMCWPRTPGYRASTYERSDIGAIVDCGRPALRSAEAESEEIKPCTTNREAAALATRMTERIKHLRVRED